MPFGYDEDKQDNYIEVKGERFYQKETKPDTWAKIAPTWEQYLKQRGVTQEDVSKLSPDVAAGKYYQPYTEIVTQQKTPAKDVKDPYIKAEREQEQKDVEEKQKKAFTFAEREKAGEEAAAAQAVLPGAKPLEEARQQKAELATTPPPPGAMAPTGALTPTVAPAPTTAPSAMAPVGMGGVPILQETQIQATTTSPEFKKAQKSMEQSYSKLAEATAIKAKAEIEDADAMQVAAEKASIQMGKDLTQINDTVTEYKTKLEEVRARSDEISKKLENYQMKGFFEGRTGARVMAGIAVAMGGVGSAFTGGPNQAMQIIQNSIENDLALQKANYEKLRGSLEATNTLYGQIRQSGLDDVAQKYTFMKTRYDQTIQQARAMADKMTDDEKKARMQAVIQQLNIQKADAVMKAEDANKRTVVTSLKPMTTGLTPIDKEKAISQFEDNISKSPIAEATSISQAAKKFQELSKMGGPEQALLVAEFIAGKQGIGQGSYSPAFTESLKSLGLYGKTKEEIARMLTGAQSASLVNAIGNFYETAARQATERAVEYAGAANFVDRARSLNIKPEFYFNQMHAPTLQKMFNTGGGQGVRRVP